MTSSREIVFVSKNQGKIREAGFILQKFGIGMEVAELDKIEIQANTSEEIASHSASQIFPRVGRPLIVEDAGLYVEALSGFPGPYSHYVLETIGCEGVLRLLEPFQRRDAYFESAVAFIDHAGVKKTFNGRVEGVLSDVVRGSNGFGFDPIFVPSGWLQTFGEVSLEVKSEISHRRRSLEAFASWYNTRSTGAP